VSGAEWIAEKINGGGIDATVQSENVVFLERADKPDAYVGVVYTPRGEANPIVSVDDAKAVYGQNSEIAMMIAIPRAARWSGSAMRWLESKGIAWGGVGDLLSAMSHDHDMSSHRNKTWAFVDDGLRRHSRVRDLEWIDSKCVEVRLLNRSVVIVALEDAYDITMQIARQAAKSIGKFDVLLKTNPNGSITSKGAENVERLGFQTLKWGELFGYLAKRGG
jgi:hypothetical protein